MNSKAKDATGAESSKNPRSKASAQRPASPYEFAEASPTASRDEIIAIRQTLQARGLKPWRFAPDVWLGDDLNAMFAGDVPFELLNAARLIHAQALDAVQFADSFTEVETITANFFATLAAFRVIRASLAEVEMQLIEAIKDEEKHSRAYGAAIRTIRRSTPDFLSKYDGGESDE